MDHPRRLLRRRLASFAVPRIPHRFTDLLVIGSGIAGLSAALAANRRRPVETLLIAKDELEECSTRYAQGGIAAVLDPDRCHDSPRLHIEDTLRAGGGLADPEIVELVVTEGIEAVRDLIDLGVRFDRDGSGAIHFTREGGHSRPRILHSADSTGREIMRALVEAARRVPSLTCLARTFAVDLLVSAAGVCRGALVYREPVGLEAIWARQVVLATGGAGRLYRETTNPPVSTGDGIAMAFRAGATLRDMEFVQFHPTTLYVAGADRFLITEAVRGEGGTLIDSTGERFMERFHPRAELAPRDVVSRGIVRRMEELGENRVFLDLSAIPPERIRERFPHIVEICSGFGLDITREPIPVRPSAHYTIGGVRVDRHGGTDLPGLLAAGEVSSTGLHGANRLGSNSLLEGLVFGRRAGSLAAERLRGEAGGSPQSPFERLAGGDVETGGGTGDGDTGEGGAVAIDLDDLERSLQSLLWRDVGIERHGERLRAAREQIGRWITYALRASFDDPTGWTLQNMLMTAYLITSSAARREDSRGVHFRSDFPEPRPEWETHLEVSRRSIAERVQ